MTWLFALYLEGPSLLFLDLAPRVPSWNLGSLFFMDYFTALPITTTCSVRDRTVDEKVQTSRDAVVAYPNILLGLWNLQEMSHVMYSWCPGRTWTEYRLNMRQQNYRLPVQFPEMGAQNSWSVDYLNYLMQWPLGFLLRSSALKHVIWLLSLHRGISLMKYLVTFKKRMFDELVKWAVGSFGEAVTWIHQRSPSGITSWSGSLYCSPMKSLFGLYREVPELCALWHCGCIGAVSCG
jgi:hypothetical protein